MENNNPRVSVIVPVYKAEAYLHRCVDSLLSQTFQDYEILLVDDGSPDKSGEICDEYAKKDSRVRVFHKGNGGVSSARQCGIDNARGEYTIHADPDDWVEPEMLEELYKKAKEDDADMVICDFYVERKENTKYVKQEPSSLNHEVVLRELFQQLHGSCCNKLVRRACYNKFNIRFPLNLNYCEDFLVCLSLLKYELIISYKDRAYYHYDQIVNDESITRKYTKNTYIQRKLFLLLLKDKIDVAYYRKEYAVQIALIAFEAFCSGIFSSSEYRKEFYFNRKLLLLGGKSLKVKILLYLSSFGLNTLIYNVCRRYELI